MYKSLKRVESIDTTVGKKLLFSLGGINCSNCTRKIENAVNKLNGVNNCSASAMTYQLFVESVSLGIQDEIIATVEKLGFRCEYVPKVTERQGSVRLDITMSKQSTNELKQSLPGIERVESFNNYTLVNFEAGSLKVRDILTHVKEHMKFKDAAIYIQRKNAKSKHDELQTRQLIASSVIAGAILFLSMILPAIAHSFLMNPHFRIGQIQISLYILLILILATVIQFVFGYKFYKSACYSLRGCNMNMDVLVIIGTTVAYVYGVAYMFFEKQTSMEVHENAHLFQTSSLLIAIVLVGKFLEALAKMRARKGLQSLASVQVTTAILFDPVSQEQTEIDIHLVGEGDLLKVYNGALIPVDGVVTEGAGTVSEAIVTGESEPLPKQVGDKVLGGTQLIGGRLIMKVTNSASESTVNKIVGLVEQAQASKAPIQSVADKVSCFFVPLIIALGSLTWIIWAVVVEYSPQAPRWLAEEDKTKATFIVEFGIAVIVISCPCALGLATPAVVMVATSMAAKMGILVKGGRVLQSIREVKTVVFDKTGTLTSGNPLVSDAALEGGNQQQFGEEISRLILQMLHTTEKNSEHPLAKAIAEYCKDSANGFKLANFQTFAGQGVVGTFKLGDAENAEIKATLEEMGQISENKATIYVGNQSLLERFKLFEGLSDDMKSDMARQEEMGKTVVVAIVGLKGDVMLPAMYLGLKERHSSKQEADSVLNYLRRRGLDVWMLTGDNWGSAYRVAETVGIPREKVIAGVRPHEKKAKIEEIQKITKKKVMMVGDGVNDSPSLAQADVGVAINCSTDITVEAAEVVIIRNNLKDVANALWLCGLAFARIRLNFLWAFLYNVILIPVAAGILFPCCEIKLSPIFASIAMSMSSISVILSSILLRCSRPPFKT